MAKHVQPNQNFTLNGAISVKQLNHQTHMKMDYYNLYFGPFKVIQKVPNNDNVYELDLGKAFDKTGQTSRLVNVKNLRPFASSRSDNLRGTT